MTASCRVPSTFDSPVYVDDSITKNDDGGAVVEWLLLARPSPDHGKYDFDPATKELPSSR